MSEIESKAKNAESENKKMFRSRFDMFVLNALDSNGGASYGYDVINYIQEKTKGHYKIKTFSTIYNTLKRLEENGYVSSGDGDGKTNGATRVYYTLTEKGKEYLQENKVEYMYMRTLLDNLLTDKDFDLENEEPPFFATELKPLTKRVRSDNGGAIEETDEATVSDTTEKEVAAEAIVTPSLPQIKPEEIYVTTTEEPIKPQVQPRKRPNNDYKAVFERLTYPVLNPEKKKNSAKATVVKPKTVQQTKPRVLEAPKAETISSPAYNAVDLNKLDTYEDNISRLRKSFKNDGYNLTAYQKPEKSVGVKFIYINKFIRDCVVISALYLIIVALVLFLAKKAFGFTLTGLLVTCAVACVIALVAVLVWFKAPEKRRKDTINFKALNAGTIGFFTLFFMLDLIISLLVVNGKDLGSPEVYVPVMLASPIVIFGIVATLLHKSERYFQK